MLSVSWEGKLERQAPGIERAVSSKPDEDGLPGVDEQLDVPADAGDDRQSGPPLAGEQHDPARPSHRNSPSPDLH